MRLGGRRRRKAGRSETPAIEARPNLQNQLLKMDSKSPRWNHVLGLTFSAAPGNFLSNDGGAGRLGRTDRCRQKEGHTDHVPGRSATAPRSRGPARGGGGAGRGRGEGAGKSRGPGPLPRSPAGFSLLLHGAPVQPDRLQPPVWHQGPRPLAVPPLAAGVVPGTWSGRAKDGIGERMEGRAWGTKLDAESRCGSPAAARARGGLCAPGWRGRCGA